MNEKSSVIHSGLGRRKEASARVHLREGQGKIQVKKKGKQSRTLQEYFAVDPYLCQEIYRPLELFNKKEDYDLTIRVSGGGFNSQAEAIRLAISRALIKVSPEYRLSLKGFNLLKNLSYKKVERKHTGKLKARAIKPHPKR